MGEFVLHLAYDLLVMGLQDPGVAQGVAIVEHLLEMLPAEAGLVRHLADVSLHVGGAAAQDEV
jgi:hypothetical protein